jgi:hypothetical protein
MRSRGTRQKRRAPYLYVDAVEKPLFSQISGVKNGADFSTPFLISALSFPHHFDAMP